MSEPLDLSEIKARDGQIGVGPIELFDWPIRDRRALLAEVERLRAELAQRDQQIAAAFDEGCAAGRLYQDAYIEWFDSDDEDTECPSRPANPYRDGEQQ